MLQCQNCHRELPQGAQFCGSCGSRQEKPQVLPSQQSNANVAPVHHPAPAKDKASSSQTEIDVRKWLAENRVGVAAKLLTLIPLVKSQRRNENKLLFEKNSSHSAPPLEHESWENIAFVTGVYGRIMCWYDLNTTQLYGLWDALVWSVLYELTFRPKMTEGRFHGLIDFFNVHAKNTDFIGHIVQDIEILVESLDADAVKQFKNIVDRLAPSPEILQLRKIVDASLSIPVIFDPDKTILGPLYISPKVKKELSHIITAIDHLWFLLDRSLETSNRRLFKFTSEHLNEPQTPQLLATLCNVIGKNAVVRYARNGQYPDSNLTDEQIEEAILLADFAAHNGTGEYAAKSEGHAVLLNSLRSIRAHAIDPEAFVSEQKARFVEEGKLKSTNFSWSDQLGIVTRSLKERRETGDVDAVEAEAWVRAFASVVQLLKPADRNTFISEALRHQVRDSMALRILQGEQGEPSADSNEEQTLAFLSAEKRKELQTSIRHSHLEQVGGILRAVRPELLAELGRVLADPAFNEIQPPRRRLLIRGRNASVADRFQEAKSLIMSSHQAEQKEGLALFERAEDYTARMYIPLAREWRLFALASVHGPFAVVKQWEDNRIKGIASWEEIWNLAVFYIRVKDLKQALVLLEPGIKEMRAPYSHLRFALSCAIQLLLEQEKGQESALSATRFLIEHLEKLPLAECYLAWAMLVSEAQGNNSLPIPIGPLKQLEVLTISQELLERPITILRPEDTLSDNTLEAFQKQLRHIGQKDPTRFSLIWRFWLNDYAERNRYKVNVWQSLADAYEQAGETTRVEEVWLHIVAMQLETYQRSPNKNSATTNLGHLKGHLIKLFDFYQRNGRIHDGDVETTFKHYYRVVPELWKGKDAAHNRLTKLTLHFLEKAGKVPAADATLSRNPTQIWYELASDFSDIQNVNDLNNLQKQLGTTIELLAGEQKAAKERASVVIQVLNELCALATNTLQRDELVREADRLNGAIQNVAVLIEQEAVLKTLGALVEVFRRVFKKFSDVNHLAPILQLDQVPLGGGVPNDMAETALVLRINNPRPTEITDVHFSCTGKGVIASNRDAVIEHLEANDAVVVAIPVTVSAQPESKQISCQITVTYQWGVVKDLAITRPMTVKLFSFHDFLQRYNIHDFDFPNPYVFDKPIDPTTDEAVLFQGRESELAQIRTIFFKGQMTGAPLYFHGIRKVGKTSLLKRIVQVLNEKQELFEPCLVDLKSVKAAQQTLPMVVHTFTQRVLLDAQQQGLDVQDIAAVPMNHPQPASALEQFFNELRECTGSRQLVLLLDAFYQIVAEHTTELLDLIHHMHRSGVILFITSGWLRPESLRQACPQTQLFPLVSRPIDFLPLSVVKQVLREPVARLGIEIPNATAQQAFLQTAGNPYHVAKIAYNGIVRLNAQHRTVLTPQDIDEIADQLAADPANFISSSFSPLILTTEEQNVAIRFAKETQEKGGFLPVEEVSQLFHLNTIQALEEKYILEYRRDAQGERLHIRSKMLATFLSTRMVEPIMPTPPTSNRKRVGLFVDYENIQSLVPGGMSAKEVGEALIRAAASYGDVVCRWACADPRNIWDLPNMKRGLEQAGFQVQFPSGETQTGPAKKNLTDFVLIELIYDESTHTDPNIYIIVSGDKDYYQRITNLLKGGYIVRIFASMSDGHLAEKYKKLVEERRHHHIEEGNSESDFFIDDLDGILQRKASPVE